MLAWPCVAPRKDCPLQSATGRVLPLSLAWQLLAGPARICLSIFEGDVGDGMIISLGVLAVRSPGMSPVRAGHVGPPAARVVQRYWAGCGMKDNRSLAQE